MPLRCIDPGLSEGYISRLTVPGFSTIYEITILCLYLELISRILAGSHFGTLS